ncbi:MAG: BON domain-containing protein [Deinococcales bacterium]
MWPFGKSATDSLKDEMKKYPFLANQSITFTERGGTVYWNGVVASDSVKNFLETLPRGINGIKNVDVSNVTVLAPEEAQASQVETVDDTVIQEAIDKNALSKAVFAAFQADPELRDDPIAVLQSGDGVVLRGAVDSQHEFNLAVKLAQEAGANRIMSDELQIVEAAKAKAKEAVQAEEAKKPAYVNLPDEYHIVKPGETLSAISVKYYGDASHVAAIAKASGVSNPDLIKVGQKLQIPR